MRTLILVHNHGRYWCPRPKTMRGNAQTLPCDDPTNEKRSRARLMTNHDDCEHSSNKLLPRVVTDFVFVQSMRHSRNRLRRIASQQVALVCMATGRVRLHRNRSRQIASQQVASDRNASQRPRRLVHLVLAPGVQQSLEVRHNHQATT